MTRNLDEQFEAAELDALFAEAAAEVPVPSDALTARILADAQSQLPQAAPQSNIAEPFWASLFQGLGGWPTISGLAAATVAGVYIGVAPTAALEAITTNVLGSSIVVDVAPDFDYFALEG
ncbi:MAG: hypothetical protein P8M63_09395 [Paracoccaceae bacterium]|jgi:hypothetical protein|nr:hypothetical protein [Paracoccaceae bacterium]